MIDKMDALFDRFHRDITELIEKEFHARVVPFCEARDWEFMSGMGSYWLGDKEGHMFSEGDLDEDEELRELIDFLDDTVPGLPGNNIGSMMPGYKTRKEIRP